MNWMLEGDFAPQPMDYRLVALSLVMAFLCGQLVAWLYSITHNGLSYSRSFVKALVVMPVLVAMVLMVLSSSIVTAFGLMAVLTIVRFRNVLRDTLDTTYLLAGIVLGLACGTQRYTTVLIGATALTIIFVYLWVTAFGTRHSYDLILHLSWSRPAGELKEVFDTLSRHARKVQRAGQHITGAGATDLSCRLLLRDPTRAEEMVTELRGLEGVTRVNTVVAENESEA